MQITLVKLKISNITTKYQQSETFICCQTAEPEWAHLGSGDLTNVPPLWRVRTRWHWVGWALQVVSSALQHCSMLSLLSLTISQLNQRLACSRRELADAFRRGWGSGAILNWNSSYQNKSANLLESTIKKKKKPANLQKQLQPSEVCVFVCQVYWHILNWHSSGHFPHTIFHYFCAFAQRRIILMVAVFSTFGQKRKFHRKTVEWNCVSTLTETF